MTSTVPKNSSGRKGIKESIRPNTKPRCVKTFLRWATVHIGTNASSPMGKTRSAKQILLPKCSIELGSAIPSGTRVNAPTDSDASSLTTTLRSRPPTFWKFANSPSKIAALTAQAEF